MSDLCECCKKQEAVVHVTRVYAAEPSTRHHYCESCARRMDRADLRTRSIEVGWTSYDPTTLDE